MNNRNEAIEETKNQKKKQQEEYEEHWHLAYNQEPEAS